MAEIKKLSSEIIGQIAAGEVVERPASAVKELVENSIDAGAKNITVELRDGGISYLRVSDNGKGIPANQIRIAFERHATSKISAAQDLFDLHTLGFRGEALASIAAVSKVTVTTKTADADFGVRAVVEGGDFSDIRQAASPNGTTIIMENLFYNTPVRLKFLKKPAAEASFVTDYMLRLMLSHPEISFRYVSQGKNVYHTTGDGKIESALYAVYGAEAFKQMIHVHGSMGGLLLNGYVGAGELCRGNRLHQSFFINGRFFKSDLLSKALEAGCEGRVMVGRFPMCALFLELPSQQIDVNVHPNKLEIRFQNENAVAASLQQIVYDALHEETVSSVFSEEDSLPDVSQNWPEVQAIKQELPPKPATLPNADTSYAVEPDYSVPRTLYDIPLTEISYMPEPALAQNGVSYDAESPIYYDLSTLTGGPVPPQEKQDPLPVDKEAEQMSVTLTEEKTQPLRFVGVVFKTYWIFETEDRLLWVDQHAAHERFLYDSMIQKYESGVISQQLLTPVLVKMLPNEVALAEEFLPVLSQAGFEADVFDDTTIALRAIPTLFGENAVPQDLFMEAYSEWQSGKTSVTRDKIRGRVAQMACKHAIKGGDELSQPEMERFVRDLLSSNSIPNCPHGRPIVVEMDKTSIEKRFKRIQ